ncbi:MAG: amidohydrolase family protein [Caldilineaceae bacterium]|nr:amidohydrolase family protein [Caldilineaceae bacterium]
MIIEWNHHLFHADTDRYPFDSRATYRPDASRRSTDPLADYLRRMQEAAIDRAVLVHPEPYGDDHRLVLACLEEEPQRFLATALFYPRDADAVQKLRDLVQRQPRVIAMRFHAVGGKSAYFDSFADPGVAALWRAAAELGLVVELHISADFARQVEPLIDQFSQTPVLIDHLAEPHVGNGVQFADVLALAKYDNVYMKLSGLNHFATDEPHYLSARPFTRWVVQAFGPRRMVWGSGAPGIVDAHLADYTAEERALVKGGNLARLLPW